MDVNKILIDIETRIKQCLFESNQDMRSALDEDYIRAKAEALGYKTSLECIKRTREKFKIINDL